MAEKHCASWCRVSVVEPVPLQGLAETEDICDGRQDIVPCTTQDVLMWLVLVLV